MLVLPDTNVLLLSLAPGEPSQPVAETAILTLAGAGHTLAIVPQVLYEAWVVATRPKTVKGFGKMPAE